MCELDALIFFHCVLTLQLIAFAAVQSSSTEPQSVTAACVALSVAGDVAKCGGAELSDVMATKAVIDGNKNRKKVLDVRVQYI